MKLVFYGKNLTIRDNVKEETEKKLQRLDKYFQDDVIAKVTMSLENNDRCVEITIPLSGSGTILRAERNSDDFLDSVDQCVNGLVSQIRKYKTKLERRRHDHTSVRFAEIENLPEEELAEEVNIVRTKEIEASAMTPEEAVDQMELLGHDFFLFLNMEVGQVCCVYKRKAGDYGLLIPSK